MGRREHGVVAIGAPVGREHGGLAMAVTGALTGRVALTGCWGLLAAVSLATVSS